MSNSLTVATLRATGPMRRMLILFIALAFGVVFARLAGVEGARSVPETAVPAGLATIAVAVLVFLASASEPELAIAARLRIPGLDPRSRSFVNGGVWAFVALGAVHFSGPAFDWVPGGHEVAGALLAAALGSGTAVLHRGAIEHDAYRTFNLVSLLLAAGSLASMSITTTGQWWTRNFSTLGTSDDLAALCFNAGIIVAGLGMAALGPALTQALRAPGYGARRGGVVAARVLIAVIGLSLVGVGAVPIDTDTVLHNVFACGAAAGFAGLAGGVTLFARRMPRRLVVISYCFLAVEVLAMVAYDRLGLFTLTVFELIAFTLVFAWLIALVATTVSPPDDARRLVRASDGRRHGVARRRRMVDRPQLAAVGARPAPGRVRAVAARTRVSSCGCAGILRSDASADEPPDRTRRH